MQVAAFAAIIAAIAILYAIAFRHGAYRERVRAANEKFAAMERGLDRGVVTVTAAIKTHEGQAVCWNEDGKTVSPIPWGAKLYSVPGGHVSTEPQYTGQPHMGWHHPLD
jgi:hypothetical protein